MVVRSGSSGRPCTNPALPTAVVEVGSGEGGPRGGGKKETLKWMGESHLEQIISPSLRFIAYKTKLIIITNLWDHFDN